jgi:hypothetical protein
MLIAPRIVGDRLHRGKVIRSDRIPPMLDRETFDRLRAALEAPRGRSTSVRSYYLTGVAYCGRQGCGAKLSAHRTTGGVRRYACRRGRQGCGQLVVAAHYIEPLIAEAIAQRLDSPEFREAVADVAERTDRAVYLDRLRADQDALEETSRLFLVERVIAKPEFLKVRAELESRIAATRKRLEASAGGSTIAALGGIDVRERWEREAVEWQHEVAAAIIDRVIVQPAPRRGTRFDPSRIDVEWRQ